MAARVRDLVDVARAELEKDVTFLLDEPSRAAWRRE
jgi:hypothetical protein